MLVYKDLVANLKIKDVVFMLPWKLNMENYIKFVIQKKILLNL